MQKNAESPSGPKEASWEQDAKLIQSAGDGDRPSQKRLLETALPIVKKTVTYLIRSSSELEDAVQSSLLAILEGASRFRGQSSLSTWARRITIRTTLRQADRRRRLAPVADMESRLRSVMPAGEHALLSEELQEYLDQLPKEQRIALLLRYALDYRVEEIAEVTEVSKNTAKYRLKGALAKMRRFVRRDFTE